MKPAVMAAFQVEGVRETVDEVPEDAKAGAKSGESGAVNAGNTEGSSSVICGVQL